MKSIKSYNRSELSNKFYGDDTKRTFENRTRYKDWAIDESIFSSSIRRRIQQNPDSEINQALTREAKMVKKAKSFIRTTPEETFADNHYDLFYDHN